MTKVKLTDIGQDLDDINVDTDSILEDTTEIVDTTQSIDKKIWILISLWMIDKIVILAMLLWVK